MGGCQSYFPLWGTLNMRCRIIKGVQKGTIILTTAHMFVILNSQYGTKMIILNIPPTRKHFRVQGFEAASRFKKRYMNIIFLKRD